MKHKTELNADIARITDRIRQRSRASRESYLAHLEDERSKKPVRGHLSCGNQAHAYAATGSDKATLAAAQAPNIGIVTAYNDMLSAHQPFCTYPDLIKMTARKAGGTAQVAGGVPAMCDGVTQGQPGMELSLFSRDVIALSSAVALSHGTFDSSIYLGVCDKIVPGMLIAAASFGHLPAVFLPAGPMPSGLPNDEKSRVRQQFSAGEIGREELMKAEMASYHAPGTCTFYGTANSNQMLLEFMGLHLPGASFVNPHTPLRKALTEVGTRRALEITALGNDYRPAGRILDEKAFVNGIVGLMATGGSTNLVIHLTAVARAAGIELRLDDFSDISDVVPLMARVYPNGLADVNHFHAAGGLAFLIGQLLDAGLLHEKKVTIFGDSMRSYTREPKLIDGELIWEGGPLASCNERILRPFGAPFSATGGLKRMHGNLGNGVIKVSSVAPARRKICAPALVFEDQDSVKAAFRRGLLDRDAVVVVRGQGPRANGMPELHSLTPVLSVVQDRGYRTALLTDGRMSGASGKIPAVIHVSPEARGGGPIALLRDGDTIYIDAEAGVFGAQADDFLDRTPPIIAADECRLGTGRDLFAGFRTSVGTAESGASAIV